ncbi:MAG TPA: hypothetical protein VGN44_00675 [Candidatus Angelobacter sp.]
MQADFSVELGGDAPALEIPWCSDDPRVRYYDLKIHPELVLQIPEAVEYPELGSFLSRINGAGFPLATAKCDAWSSSEVAPEEQIFGDRKFASYIDLFFVEEKDRCSFEKNEAFAKELCRLLGHTPEIAAMVELVIRHCYYYQGQFVPNNWDGLNASVTGFCLTMYVTGFGDSDHDPVRRWTVALNLLQHAIVQLNSNLQPKP